MYAHCVGGRAAFAGLVRIQSTAEIASLIKEREMLTGEPGRVFEIHGGADRIRYRIDLRAAGFEVQRLCDQSASVQACYTCLDFSGLPIADAVTLGYLYSPVVVGAVAG